MEPSEMPRAARTLPPGEIDEGLRPATEAVRRHWKPVLAVFLLVIGLGTWSAMNLPAEYRAGTVISFVPRQGELNGEVLASLLVQRYPEVASSEGSVAAAAAAAGDVTPSQVQSKLQALIQPDTLNMVISVQLPTQEQAVVATDAVVKYLLRNNESDPNLRAEIISRPAPGGFSGTSTTLVLGAAIIVAVVAAFVVGLVLDAFSRSRG